MNLLECLVGIALCILLLNPLLKTSADLLIKQIEYEKSQALASEAERALELMGRAIRMAGYQNMKSKQQRNNEKNKAPVLEIQKGTGYQRSDSLVTRHELSDGVDFDCIGNTLTSDRLKNNQALQGFFLDRQAGLPKGLKVNGGSLICQSLDRQGRLQNTTLANGVNAFSIDELKSQSSGGQKAFRVRLEMTDGALIHREFERTFSTRNLP
jgi:type II secretory pathway component PulJ